MQLTERSDQPGALLAADSGDALPLGATAGAAGTAASQTSARDPAGGAATGSAQAIAPVREADAAAVPRIAPSADLFDPAADLSGDDVAGIVAQAHRQTANPRLELLPGRRAFGAGPGVWLAWDDASDAPALLPSGGVAILAAQNRDALVGVARDGATGEFLVWDGEANRPWPDAEGQPIALPRDLLLAHATAGGLTPLAIAQAVALASDITAAADADADTIDGRLAGLEAGLWEISQPSHPLSSLAGPYAAAMQELWPQITGAVRWSRVAERNNAFAIADQFVLQLMRGVLDSTQAVPSASDERFDPTRQRPDGGVAPLAGEPVPPAGTPDADLELRVDTSPLAIRDILTGRVEIDPTGMEEVETSLRSAETEAPFAGTRALAGTDLVVIWNEETQSIARSDAGGYLFIDASRDPAAPAFGALVDTATGDMTAWDARTGEAYRGSAGEPIVISASLLAMHSDLRPRDLLFSAAFSDALLAHRRIVDLAMQEDADPQQMAPLLFDSERRLAMLIEAMDSRESAFSHIAQTNAIKMAVQDLVAMGFSVLSGHSEDRGSYESDFEYLYYAVADPMALLTIAESTPLNVDYSEYEDHSIGEIAEDIVVQAAGGVVDAMNETIEFADDVAVWMEDIGFPNLYIQILNEDGEFDLSFQTVEENREARADGTYHSLRLPDLPPANTRAGQLIRGFTHFAAGYIGAGKVLRLWRPVTAGGRVTKANVQGFISDFVAYDPLDERFSNWVNSDPELRTLATEFLAADPDDSDALGRLKNGLEGLGIGLIADGLISTLRLVRSNAVRRLAWRLPGSDRAFVRSIASTPAIPNRLADNVSAATLAAMSPQARASAGRAFSAAIGKAGELSAQIRLSTWSRTVSDHPRISIGGSRHAIPDYQSAPNFIGSFLRVFRLETSDSIVYEIKTGAGRLTTNQRILEAQLAQTGNAGLFQVLRIPLSEIPNDILLETMRKYLDRFHVPASARDALLNELKAAHPNMPFFYLADFIARGTVEMLPMAFDGGEEAGTPAPLQ